MEETYNCSEQCESLDISIDQNQLAYRLIKLRIRVLRANIGKLLCLCVPARDKWSEFGWDGKTVDDILDDLSKIDIPVYHPGDPEFQQVYKEHEKLNQQHLASKAITKHSESVLQSVPNQENSQLSLPTTMGEKEKDVSTDQKHGIESDIGLMEIGSSEPNIMQQH